MKKLLLIAGLVMLMASSAFAANTHDITFQVDEIAVLSLDDTTTVAFDVEAPATGGAAPTINGTPDTTKWVQYTSVVDSGETRKVTLALSAVVPAGLILKATAAACGAESGKVGTVGTGQSNVTITNEAADLITAIGSGYTGTAGTDGHNVSFALSFDNANFDDLVAIESASSRTATYTITATDVDE